MFENRRVYFVYSPTPNKLVFGEETRLEIMKAVHDGGISVIPYDGTDRLFIGKMTYASQYQLTMDEYVVSYVTWKESAQAERWYHQNDQKFSIDHLEQAVSCFVARYASNKPTEAVGASDTMSERFAAFHRSLDGLNRLDYLKTVLDLFWKKVHGKELDLVEKNALINADGFHIHLYGVYWRTKNISLSRGSLLYLFAPQDKSEERSLANRVVWVVENYNTYLPMIIEAEQETLKQKFNI